MDHNATINRKALGRAAQLGYLYDARKEEFCGLSLFTSELPTSMISSIDVPDTQFEYEYLDTFEQKFKKLDVQAELKVSVLAGLFKLEGCGKYLSNEKESYKSVRSSLIYSIRTKEEQFSISNANLNGLVSYDALNIPNATHVVVGIKWGANVVASFEFANKENDLKTDIEGMLKASMEKICLSISGNASVQFTENEDKFKRSLSIKFFGDVIAQNEELPQTFEQALKLMKKVPAYMKRFNDGKGKPLEYILYPLSYVERFFQLKKIDRVLIDLNNETIARIEKEFDGLLLAKQKFNDFYNEVNENSDFIVNTDIDEIAKKNKQIKINEAAFRSEIAKTLLEIRSGSQNSTEIENILNKFYKRPGFIDDILIFLENYKKLKNTINLVKTFGEQNIIYLGRQDSPEVLSLKYNNCDIYAFYMNEDLKMKNNEFYEDNYKYFLDLARNVKGKESKFFIINFDLHPEVKTKKEIKIHYYRNGKLASENLYESKKESLNWCIAKSPSMQSNLIRPVTATKLNIPCAGIQFNCPRDKKYWKCEKCEAFIEYGYDRKFYCDCGGASANSYSFKCSNPLHSDEFLTFTQDDLERYLPDKDAENEVNILLLGETGVGKSTFINALINYLAYSSLEEAEKEELLLGIFTQFTITDDNFMERTIKIGNDDNESTIVGQSSTQYAKAHVFHIDNLTLRIIDTPGIGDTRGIEMDKQNLQNTLSYISNYGYLNGICILLKPNNAKLDLAFRYCIKELLTNLHQKAVDNIIFCFTNSRGTFYKPGDTLPALRTLLRNLQEQSGVSIPLRENIFCFDNESFRFLAALKQDVQFSNDDRSDFSKSWDRSVKMAGEMLSYISKCPTHKIKETITLNESRNLIMELSKPIAEITQNIQTNIKLAEDRKKELAENRLSLNELKDKLNIPQMDLEPVSLDYPRTVCTQSKCTKVVKFKNIEKIDYITHCHPHCYLQGVETDKIHNAALQKCDAMINGICKVCDCSWATHMHITYENKHVERLVIDDNVQRMISAKQNKYELINTLIKSCDQLVTELKAEQNIIIEISAKFANFTRQNAIAVFNDDLEDYLEHLIKEEKEKRSKGSQNASIIDGLEKMKQSYKEQQKIFEEAMKLGKSSDVVKLSQIPELVRQLYSLKHNGGQLRQIVDKLKSSKSSAFKFTEKKHNIKRKNKQHKDNMIMTGFKKLGNLFS